jgi:hypothetical protein
MATANMNLTLPQVLGTPGPQYATQVNGALERVDQHDHTSGFGSPVPTAGLAIDAALPFNGNAATGLKLLQLADQSPAPDGSLFPRSVFVQGGDLYYLNGDGVAVQLTDGGVINPTGVGGFGGDYADTGAVAEYQSAQSRYTFRNPDNSLGDLYGRAANLSTTLTVAGAAALSAGLTVATTLAVSGATTLAGVTTGNASVSGTLGVTGATTLGSTLTVTGATGLASATLSGTLGVTGTSNLTTVNVSSVLNAADATSTLGVTSATNLSVSGTLGVTGATTLAALTAGGAVTFNSSLSMPTASLVSIGANAGARVQMQAGTLTATKVVSAQGLRMVVGPFVYWNGNGAGGPFTLANLNQAAGGTIGAVTLSFVFPFAGSVVALSGYYETAANNTHRVDINRNAVLLTSGASINPSTAGRNWFTAITKGATPFSAGQILTLTQFISASINQWSTVFVTIEMDPT